MPGRPPPLPFQPLFERPEDDEAVPERLPG